MNSETINNVKWALKHAEKARENAQHDLHVLRSNSPTVELNDKLFRLYWGLPVGANLKTFEPRHNVRANLDSFAADILTMKGK